MHLPRAAVYTATHVLDAQRRFDGRESRGRRQRLARHDSFHEALALQRMIRAADGAPAAGLEEWHAERHGAAPHERGETETRRHREEGDTIA
jgi:hypothetical protein